LGELFLGLTPVQFATAFRAAVGDEDVMGALRDLFVRPRRRRTRLAIAAGDGACRLNALKWAGHSFFGGKFRHG